MATDRHNVYVVELDKAVLSSKKIRDLNPSFDPKLPPLYVGMTGLNPQERFKKHKLGLKGNVWVKKHGLSLRLELYKDLNPLKFHAAERTEEQLAKKLRKAGYPVIGGNPQMRKLGEYYHGSPDANIKELRIGSYVSPSKNIAYQMGRFFPDTGKTWTDADLALKYKFHGEPQFKKGRTPIGVPTIYKTLDDVKLDKLNNPYEHITKEKAVVKQADWSEFDQQRDEALPPQQARVVKRIQDPNTPGLVLFHGMGSGKTRASIESYKALGMPADVIVPAALKENYRKELRKWTGGVPGNVNIVSQQRFSNPHLNTPLHNTGLQIVDEAQKARNNTGQLYQRLKETNPQKRLLLSGTPMLNDPSELGNLVNLAANKDVLPNNLRDFKSEYFRPKEVSPGLLGRLTGVSPGLEYELQNKAKLKGILDKYVDYYKPTQEGYPTVTEKDVKVPMGSSQQDVYNSILGKANWWTRYKVKHNIPPGRGELEGMRSFLSGPRQVSNTTAGFTTNPKQIESPKINSAFKYLQDQVKLDPTYKAVVYSNYLNNGIKPYEDLLKKNNIPYGEFSGAISPSMREQYVRDYNSNKLRALLISGAGAEGLDLKGTRLEQLLDPHWNLAKERQVIGRGARFHSHDELPADKRNVLVQRYFAQPQPSLMDRLSFNPHPTGTDEYIHNIAKQKDQMNQEVVNLIAPGPKDQRWWSSFSD